MADTVDDSKFKSRKFCIWITWLAIFVIISICAIIGFFVVKDKGDVFMGTLTKTLDYFFYISMLYLGVNLGQKGIYALKDIKKPILDTEEKILTDEQKDFDKQ